MLDMTKQELLKRVGSIDSLCRAEEFTFTSGTARGSRGIRIKCGKLAFTLLPDRCLDIAYAEVEGVPVSYDSCTGIVSPAYYNEGDFLRNFGAGMLTTCGLNQIGGDCVDGGKSYGLHGRIGNTPAYDVSVDRHWEGEDYVLTVSGKIKQTSVFGENLELIRSISVKLFEQTIAISDRVINNGFRDEPFMMLYHINFGYPLLSEDAVLTTNMGTPAPKDDHAAKDLDICHTFTAPQKDFAEQLYFYSSVPSSWARLTNENLGLFAEVSYCGDNLPYMVEWKQIGEGVYVVGLEPGTNPPEGRVNARENGRLQMLSPGETKDFSVKITFGTTN
ncbi:MAG: DUF4432 family protein [Ruminococcaceae bacterium]|nr:DUF4432 family protein [Oscillospiraceae bacterium]